jgi:uncharacterized protein YraI
MQRPHQVLSLVAFALTSACSTPQAFALGELPTPTFQSYFFSPFYWAPVIPSATLQPLPTWTPIASETPYPTPTWTPTEMQSPTLAETAIAALSPMPSGTTPGAPAASAASSLQATVNVGLLSCRYGPGPEYLYLYALRKGANVKLIGRTDGNNWHWAWVEGRNRCWVNTSYLTVQGDWRELPVVYPGIAKLPVSPYYPPTSIISVVRKGTLVTVEWAPIPLRAGDEEDDSMQHYILEVWHCQAGSLLFEPLATNNTFLTVVDEPGCSQPSHARVFVQEKHGFSGPTYVPWRPWQ